MTHAFDSVAVLAVLVVYALATARHLGLSTTVLLLAGDKDDWTPADRCRTLVSSLSRTGIVDAVYYPNAYHSFDSKVADRTVPGAAGKQHHLAYDTAAAPDAEARTKAFFAKHLR